MGLSPGGSQVTACLMAPFIGLLLPPGDASRWPLVLTPLPQGYPCSSPRNLSLLAPVARKAVVAAIKSRAFRWGVIPGHLAGPCMSSQVSL